VASNICHCHQALAPSPHRLRHPTARRVQNPRFLTSIASCDMASNICPLWPKRLPAASFDQPLWPRNGVSSRSDARLCCAFYLLTTRPCVAAVLLCASVAAVAIVAVGRCMLRVSIPVSKARHLAVCDQRLKLKCAESVSNVAWTVQVDRIKIQNQC
jgi:hypothetical protein